MSISYVYVQGDPDKTPVDPTRQLDGTMLVRVTDAGNEFPYMSLTGITNLSAQSSNLHPYQANTVPGAGDPGSGKLSWNNANQLIATQLQFSLLDQDGIDVSVFLALLGVNDIVVFQDRNDAANYQTWTVTGATTVVSNQFIQVPASLTAGSWVVPSDHQITLAVSNVGPVGPLGPTGATGPSGQGFVIAAIYATQAALLADTIPDGQFGLVVTSPPGGANDGELWLYMSPGGWVYQTDMSVQGIMGPTGDIGPTGATGPAGQSTSFYPYRANDTPGTGDPGSGKVSWNNANQLIATQIQINHVGQDGVDIDVFLALLEVADTVIIQDKSDSANYQTWTVSAPITVTPNSFVAVPVTLVAGSWSAPGNHEIIVAIKVAGPSGPTGPTGATGATGPTGPTGPTGATGTASWPGTSSQLTAGDGTAVNVGSGLSLSAGTLTASGGGGSLPSPGVYTWDFSGASPYSNLGSGGTATLAATAGTSEQSAGLWSSGRKGLRAYALDSATGAINTTTLSIPWENTSFTIEMYLQVDFMRGITGLGSNSWIFSLNSTGFPNTGGGSAINLASGNYVLGLPAFQTSRPLVGIQDAQLLNGSVALRPMHVAFVLNRSNPTAVTLTFYVDGVVAGTQSGNNPRSLGAYGLYGGPFTTVQVFMGGAGIIGWLSLDNVAKTQAQLQANTLILKAA